MWLSSVSRAGDWFTLYQEAGVPKGLECGLSSVKPGSNLFAWYAGLRDKIWV
jgi:hypothetical protein